MLFEVQLELTQDGNDPRHVHGIPRSVDNMRLPIPVVQDLCDIIEIGRDPVLVQVHLEVGDTLVSQE